MTKPGDPGHAAAAREQATSHVAARSAAEPVEATDAALPRHPLTLRRRLLAIVAALLVAVSAVIGVATVAIFHGSSVERLDASLRATTTRADQVDVPTLPSDPSVRAEEFLRVPGQPVGTLAAFVSDSTVFARYISAGGEVPELDVAATRALTEVPLDGRPHTITVGALGEYRALALALEAEPEFRAVLALPMAELNAQTTQLAWTVALVALVGLAVALVIGSAVVRRALSPLADVTATAQRVSELPLDRGDVALGERVPVDDERTEVGRLGTAFNRMLGHVASALSARERSEQKVRRFVADASHELRTPLASIRGYAELTRLHGGELPPDVVHAIGRIESESLRMTELVEDLLLLARLDEGRELAARPVDLRQLVVDAVADARAAGPDHDWHVAVPDEPVTVTGDAARLQQVLANLLANARVHTPDGTKVVVRLERVTDAAADRVRLTVTDDGQGIDADVRENLFERFARGDASRSRRAGSTGLGLAIVRAVVEAHRGTVAVESEPGRTEFRVDLPA